MTRALDAEDYDAQGLRLRTDGRLEVAPTDQADNDHGCTRDDWCILANDHRGDCCDDRERA
jgi:hypothetical protein